MIQVTAVELLGHVGGLGLDAEISKAFRRFMTKRGLKFELNSKIMVAMRVKDQTFVDTKVIKDGKTGLTLYS